MILIAFPPRFGASPLDVTGTVSLYSTPPYIPFILNLRLLSSLCSALGLVHVCFLDIDIQYSFERFWPKMLHFGLPVLVTVFIQAAVTVASTLTPPVLPLIVRNPYLSTWLGNARDAPWSRWPMFYTGEEVGLALMAQVPSTGAVYPLLGRPHDSL